MLTLTDPSAPLALLQRLDEDGYVILPGLLSADECQRVRNALSPWLQGGKPGRNDFEGYKRERVAALLAKSPVFGDLAAHPLGWSCVRRCSGRSSCCQPAWRS